MSSTGSRVFSYQVGDVRAEPFVFQDDYWVLREGRFQCVPLVSITAVPNLAGGDWLTGKFILEVDFAVSNGKAEDLTIRNMWIGNFELGGEISDFDTGAHTDLMEFSADRLGWTPIAIDGWDSSCDVTPPAELQNLVYDLIDNTGCVELMQELVLLREPKAARPAYTAAHAGTA